VSGSGSSLALNTAENNAFRFMNRVLAQHGTVRFEPGANGGTGRYLAGGIARATLDQWAAELRVTAKAVDAGADAIAAAPRIALFKASAGIIDEGWTEWLLDTYGFKYTLITPADLKAGNLASRFDVIVTASQPFGGGGGRGFRRGGPPPDTAANAAIVRGVDEFVRGGGTVVAWSQGVDAAIRALKLPVRDVVSGVSRRDFFTGISILRVNTDPAHPVMTGMPADADVVVNRGPILAPTEGFEGAVLAGYPRDGDLLRSGWLNGDKYVHGAAAALDVRHGQGHVILIGFQPQWRGQSTGTFRVVFNSLFYSGEVARRGGGTPGFWSAPGGGGAP
jgi:hypothetical protein